MGLKLKPCLRLLSLLWLACSSVALAQYVPSPTYELKPDLLLVKRHYQTARPKPVCNADDDRNWNAFRELLQRDLRAQVLFK